MKEQGSSYEEHLKSRKWVEETAKNLGVELDKGGEHFVIPFENKDGALEKIYLGARERFILADKEGKKEVDEPIEVAIEALKKYPELPFKEAIKKFKSEQDVV